MLMSHKRTLFTVLSVMIILFFYTFDLGNLNALRQGTEGFYLQIAKEMFQSQDYLTPTYEHLHHWSKPPLVFWLANLFYYLGGETSLYLARLSITVFTFVSFFFFFRFCKREMKVELGPFLLFFFATFGFIKYSRIFMMEIPLSFLTVLSVLYYYSYIIRERTKYLAVAVIFGSLSVLVKGPVSFVMIATGCSLFHLLHFSFNKVTTIRPLIKYLALTLLFASPWFIIVAIKYGREFIDYFFLRENMGKFASQTYPARSIIQGLIFYIFPWALLIPYAVRKLLLRIKNKEVITLFLLSNFICFFALWFIPAQRSHHYALPALPLFLLLIYSTVSRSRTFPNSKSYKLLHFVAFFLAALFIVINFGLLYFEDFTTASDYYLAQGFLALAIVLLIFRHKSITTIGLSYLLTLATVWIFVMRFFYLDELPSAGRDIIADTPTFTTIRRPFFMSESLGREIKNVPESIILKELRAATKNYYIIQDTTLQKSFVGAPYEILATWPYWKRHVDRADLFNAIKFRSLKPLREEVHLIRVIEAF